jgi:hypothetical protein
MVGDTEVSTPSTLRPAVYQCVISVLPVIPSRMPSPLLNPTFEVEQMRTGLLILCAGLAAIAQGQLVSVAPTDQHYCEKIEVEPNLVVFEQDTNISGRVIDGSGEPFGRSRIELRLFISPTRQQLAQTTMTDADGHFRFDEVKAGKYRFVASPTRAFRQPTNLMCKTDQCELPVTLRASPTDMPDSRCPVR